MACFVGRCFFWGLLSGLLGTMSGCGGVIRVPLSDVEGVTGGGESPSGHEEPSADCASNADCADGNPCTSDHCVGGACQHESVDPCCGDGNCTGSEACDNCPQDCFCPGCGNGICDANEDSCNCPDDCESTGCCVDADCEDDDLCTINSCVESQCASDPIVCDDGEPCTLDECVGGECVFTSIPCGNPPTAVAQVVGTRVNEAIPITLSATDPDSDPLTYLIVDGPTHGTLTGNAPQVAYEPAENYVGFDSFSFQADDGRSGVVSNTAKVRISVIDEGDLSGQTVSGDLLPGDTDLWSFQGSAGQRVVMRVSLLYPRPRLTLYPPGGGAAETATGDGRIDWRLQSSGQYSVAVENQWYLSVGYDLSVLVVGGQLESLSDLDGGAITPGETRPGQLAPACDIDGYTFEGIEGQRVLITISGAYPNPHLSLYPPGGGEREVWSSGLKIDWVLRTSGSYTIVVERNDYIAIGYSLTLQQF